MRYTYIIYVHISCNCRRRSEEREDERETGEPLRDIMMRHNFPSAYYEYHGADPAPSTPSYYGLQYKVRADWP